MTNHINPRSPLTEAAGGARFTPGPWGIVVGVSSVGMGENGIYHAVKKGIHTYTVAHTTEITGDVETTPLPDGYVRETLVNRRAPQRDPHPDVLLIAVAPDLYKALSRIGALAKANDLTRDPKSIADFCDFWLAKARGETS